MNIINYINAISMAKNMLAQGMITRKEFQIFEVRMLRKYGLPERSLYRDLHLIQSAVQR